MDVSEKCLGDLEWPALLSRLVAACQSERGEAQARALPLLDAAEPIARLLDLVSEARAIHEEDAPLPFQPIPELRTQLQRLAKEGALTGAALVHIARALRNISLVARFVRSRRDRAPGLGQLADRIDDLDHVWTALEQAFEPNGELADDASPELGQLRRRVSKLHKQITERMKQLLDKPSIAKFLQDRFYTQREERYVLPVRADAGPAVPGIVHGSSASGATIFVEPHQVVEPNNELKVAQVEVAREVARILTDLSGLVAAEGEVIETNLEAISEIDLVNARALLAIRLKAHPPSISTDGRLLLRQLCHPLMLLSGVPVVPSDIEIGPRQGLLISGPNAGGKTVCLKSVGLCALMLRAGMHLPAGPDSSLPVYARVLTDIGDDQSIEQSLSTFSGHMRHLLEFLELSQPGTLVLLDEVVSGTDPAEGAALAQALLEAFAGRGAQLAATTHYDRLKMLPLSDERFVNASVGFDLQRLRPTFELHRGTPGSSFALAVAQQLGLSDAIAQRARELAGEHQSQVADLLRELTDQRLHLTEAQQAARAAETSARAAEQEQRAKLAKLKERGKTAVMQEHAEALDELKRARAELRRLRISLRQVEGPEQLRSAETRAGKIAGRIQPHAPQREDPPGRPATTDDLVPGVHVWVRTLAGEAEVLETPRRDKVVVRFGGIRTTVMCQDLLLPHQAANAAAAPSPAASDRAGTSGPARAGAEMPIRREMPERTIDNTVDIRGMRVDEALRTTETYLDQALLRGLDVVFVLHGYGSGALRGAVRADLQLSPMVERIRAADEQHGGDAVTAVWLR